MRRTKKVRLGDGGDPELQAAIRAHGNAAEYIPISLILLFLLETGGAQVALIHIGGVAMLTGRLLHARGLLTDNLRFRTLGMQITFFTLCGLAFSNLSHAVYRSLGTH